MKEPQPQDETAVTRKRKREGKHQAGRKPKRQAGESKESPLFLPKERKQLPNFQPRAFQDKSDDSKLEEQKDGDKVGIHSDSTVEIHLTSALDFYELDKEFGTFNAEVLKKQGRKRRTGYKVLVKGNGDQMIEERIAAVEGSHKGAPKILMRAYTLRGLKRTAGCSGPKNYWPNAERNGLQMHARLLDIPYLTCQDMLGLHLKWEDPPRSEFLSFTNSWLFALIHAIGRYEKGQWPAVVAWGYASELESKAEPAKLHSAIELHKAYALLDREWKIGTLEEDDNEDNNEDELHIRRDHCYKLHPRKFTHEWLTHGIVNDPDGAMRHVELGELYANGLLYLYPELDVRGVCERTGLYTQLTALRRGMFYNATDSGISVKDLIICENIAKLFQHPEQEKAPLHLIIQTLALRKRMSENAAYQTWIKKNYEADDVRKGLYDSIHIVADNLPEVIQYVDLLREACVALDVPPIPETILVHDNGGAGKRRYPYRSEDLFHTSSREARKQAAKELWPERTPSKNLERLLESHPNLLWETSLKVYKNSKTAGENVENDDKDSQTPSDDNVETSQESSAPKSSGTDPSSSPITNYASAIAPKKSQRKEFASAEHKFMDRIRMSCNKMDTRSTARTRLRAADCKFRTDDLPGLITSMNLNDGLPDSPDSSSVSAPAQVDNPAPGLLAIEDSSISGGSTIYDILG